MLGQTTASRIDGRQENKEAKSGGIVEAADFFGDVPKLSVSTDRPTHHKTSPYPAKNKCLNGK